MPNFPKPTFSFGFTHATEVAALQAHKAARGIPDKTENSILIATWNIANLGSQDRERRHYRLIAEMLSWFDLIAIQEVKSDLVGLELICKELGDPYRMVFTDVAGNDERLAFIYDSQKVRTLELVGELAINPADSKHVKLPGIERKFDGFDRNPFLQSFVAARLSLFSRMCISTSAAIRSWIWSEGSLRPLPWRDGQNGKQSHRWPMKMM